MAEFMIRALVVGGLATLAAFVFEQALLHARLPARYAWTFALLLTITLPFVPRLSDQPVTEGIPVVVVPSVVVTAATEVESGMPFDVLLFTWLVLLTLVLVAYLRAYLRLQNVRKGWRGARIDDVDVFVSDGFGPAVFGFLRPRIVVPEWVRAAAAEEQRLILLHEQEHIRVRDQWQLLLSIVTTAVMPWNPFLWLQARRLGFRVETDCDARVLAIAPDAQRYANLLLSVGAKQNGLLLMPALAEERRGLERRLHMMAKGIVQNRWKAAGLLVLGAVVTVMACESRLPNEPQQPTPALVPTTTESLQRKQDGRTAQEPNVAELAQKYYPPLLRDAGIGGLVGIEATVRTSGAVDNYRIVRSSGHAALDQAGLRVVKEMRLLPRRVPAGQQPKDEVHRIFLDFKKGEVDQTWVHRNPKSQEVSAPDTAVVLPAMLDAQERQDQPHFTPYTKKPEVRNRAEIQVALAREYPPLLRDAGIEGTVLLWLLLNEQGDVVKAQLKTSSGRAELDSAGVSVAKRMKFTPAENRGRRVKVWIALPIVFKTK